MKTHRIAVIAGDGIGKEVIPAGIQVLKVAAEHDGFQLDFTDIPGAATTTSKRGGCSTPTGATSS
jgi:tartrate dehydrogenase/decarboxylase/D-malate dehydrogenase